MSKGSILVVEDEVIIAEDLADKVRRFGYEVGPVCVSGEQAIETAGRLRPDLVLMDIRLAGDLDGVEAANAIRHRFDLPVIYLTAHADAATLTRAKLTEPSGYILKPFDEQILSIQLELALYKHKTERELRAQREWLRLTLTSIADAVLATDAASRVTFVNPVAETLLGCGADQIIGQPLDGVLHLKSEETGKAIDDLSLWVLKKHQPVPLTNHAVIVTRAGRAVPVESSAAPMLDDHGKVIGMVLVFRDVTERRRSAEALNASLRDLRAAQDELVRKERLAVLGQLAGGVAHELRTPLNVVRNSVYYLQGSGEDEQGRREAFEEGNRAIANCDHIIGEMLEYVREPSRSSSVFPIGEAISQALKLVLVPKNVRLVRSGSSGGSQVRANLDQVTRIFANLILNAVQAMPEGGDLEIHESASRGGPVSVEVRDAGCGIPPENLEKIFDPLFTTKARGIGLGLAVCQRYAQLNQARLTAESPPGRGATFRLVLEPWAG